MFESYEIDFGKLNLSWLHSVSIELNEIAELLELSPLTWLYLGEGGEYEITGYTKYRKFVTVNFRLTEHEAVVECKPPQLWPNPRSRHQTIRRTAPVITPAGANWSKMPSVATWPGRSRGKSFWLFC